MAKSTTYEAMGIAATIPGLQRAAEILQQELNALREQLAALQNGAAPPKRKQERPLRQDRAPHPGPAQGKGGWSDDPAERSQEMARRVRVIKLKEEWLKKAANRRKWERASHTERKEIVAGLGGRTLPERSPERSRVALDRWRQMSERKRRAWQRAMQAGKKAKTQPVKLEAAS
jgi:hypothetical protein